MGDWFLIVVFWVFVIDLCVRNMKSGSRFYFDAAPLTQNFKPDSVGTWFGFLAMLIIQIAIRTFGVALVVVAVRQNSLSNFLITMLFSPWMIGLRIGEDYKQDYLWTRTNSLEPERPV